MSTTTDTYSFTLYLRGVDVLSDGSMAALHAAGCDDATLGARDGQQYAAFDREAPNLDDAIASATSDLTRALPSLVIVGVDPTGPTRIGMGEVRTRGSGRRTRPLAKK